MFRQRNAFLLLTIFALLSCKDERITPADKPSCIAFPEECNGFDDDCDGIIDNAIKPESCYPRDENELTYGQCSYGKTACIGATIICTRWTGPSYDICDGIDNDCDGLTDENSSAPLDMIFAVDYSGSMIGIIGKIEPLLASWVVSKANVQDLRLSLVGIPDLYHDGKVTVIQNLTTVSGFIAALPRTNTVGGGNETQLDLLADVADVANPLGFQWTPGAQRVVVMFTDEPPYSYRDPRLQEWVVKRNFYDSGTRLFVFSDDPVWYQWNKRLSLQGIDEVNFATTLEQIFVEGKCK